MADAKDFAQDQLKNASVKVGQQYTHYKNDQDKYEIVGVGLQEDTLEPVVMYRSLTRGTFWVRTVKNFTETVKHNGRQVPRFQRIERAPL